MKVNFCHSVILAPFDLDTIDARAIGETYRVVIHSGMSVSDPAPHTKKFLQNSRHVRQFICRVIGTLASFVCVCVCHQMKFTVSQSTWATRKRVR